ncbi:MAG TPA: hypothetical protein VKC60_10680 [Opitutaceae bacterium]|nr:hypothetical protein [Opitutaceae bacterium]
MAFKMIPEASFVAYKKGETQWLGRKEGKKTCMGEKSIVNIAQMTFAKEFKN